MELVGQESQASLEPKMSRRKKNQLYKKPAKTSVHGSGSCPDLRACACRRQVDRFHFIRTRVYCSWPMSRYCTF